MWLSFTVLLVVCFVANKSYETFFFRPCSTHLWRQADGASYALNYYQNKGPFLPPQVHHRHAENGYAVSEFPVVYYVAATMYSVFGFHDYYIRWLHFALFIVGLIYLVLLTKRYTNHLVLQLLPALAMMTSPYLYYYSANFLPDVAALSLALVGLYYFLRFTDTKQTRWFLLSLGLFTLAALLKISAAILLCSSVGYLLYDIIWGKKLFVALHRKHIALVVLSTLVSFLLIFLWIVYAKYVAERYHFGGNLLGFFGIWDADANRIRYILGMLWSTWLKVIFSKYWWLLTISCVLVFAARWKKLPRELAVITLCSLTGTLLYGICWFQAFDVHDYYLINLFCSPLLLFLCGIYWLDNTPWMQTRWAQPMLYAALLFLGVHSIVKCRAEQLYRYYDPAYASFTPAVYELEPYLRKIGIQRTDKVMFVPDLSPNASLYLINQLGYTECYTDENYGIDVFVGMHNTKYLIVADTSYLRKPPYASYCKPENQVGFYKGIYIFKIQPEKQASPVQVQ